MKTRCSQKYSPFAKEESYCRELSSMNYYQYRCLLSSPHFATIITRNDSNLWQKDSRFNNQHIDEKRVKFV